MVDFQWSHKRARLRGESASADSRSVTKAKFRVELA